MNLSAGVIPIQNKKWYKHWWNVLASTRSLKAAWAKPLHHRLQHFSSRIGMRRCWLAGGLIPALLLLGACQKAPTVQPPFPPRAPDEFSVMSYNLRLFNFTDRDDDGQDDDFKPETEITPLVNMIRDANPDILALQELGDASTLIKLQQRLREAGLEFPHRDHLAAPSPFVNLGVLSRFPILNSEPITNLSYSIRDRAFVVQRGFQQVTIQVNDHFHFQLINVHLKSKMFHESGQTEMRRNEARLLASHIRKLGKENPDLRLVVTGDFNDIYNSAPMRELLDQDQVDLTDLQLTDRYGDRWTHYFRRDQTYSRIDYILVNRSMNQRWVENKSGIVRDKQTYDASDHRPIMATFTAK